MSKLDVDRLWNQLEEFRYKGMLTLKNLDNHLPTESWDSMYHTGLYLIIAGLRLKRTNDESIVEKINETLDVFLKEGTNFRGYNSEGEYWKDYMRRKYYDEWHDKEEFRDSSRDQVLSMNFGLYFLYENVDHEKYPSVIERVKKVAKMAFDELTAKNFNLGTTYGDCRTYEIPFSLLYRLILGEDTKMRKSLRSELYYRTMPIFWSIYETEHNYFSYDLMITVLFLVCRCESVNDGTYSKNIGNAALRGFKRIMKNRKKDKNLFWEIMYYYCAGEFIVERDFRKELKEIFEPFEDPKIQDFIWERHPVNRYKPYEEWKHFYAPWHDYLIVYEMLEDLGI